MTLKSYLSPADQRRSEIRKSNKSAIIKVQSKLEDAKLPEVFDRLLK